MLNDQMQKVCSEDIFCENTRTADVSFAPEVARLQAREAQLSFKVWAMRSQETECETQFLTLQQENGRLNDLRNQIRGASESMDMNNLGPAQQLQTSKFELRRAHTEVSHLRSSVRRNQSSDTRDA